MENKVPVKEQLCFHVFSTKFSLQFKLPNKDACQLQNEYEIKISEN
jgi:hypothetical protein